MRSVYNARSCPRVYFIILFAQQTTRITAHLSWDRIEMVRTVHRTHVCICTIVYSKIDWVFFSIVKYIWKVQRATIYAQHNIFWSGMVYACNGCCCRRCSWKSSSASENSIDVYGYGHFSLLYLSIEMLSTHIPYIYNRVFDISRLRIRFFLARCMRNWSTVALNHTSEESNRCVRNQYEKKKYRRIAVHSSTEIALDLFECVALERIWRRNWRIEFNWSWWKRKRDVSD